MVFCNLVEKDIIGHEESCHNPYFNRWFSAIIKIVRSGNTYKKVTILILIDGFLQYQEYGIYEPINNVTILILIDGFLQ